MAVAIAAESRAQPCYQVQCSNLCHRYSSLEPIGKAGVSSGVGLKSMSVLSSGCDCLYMGMDKPSFEIFLPGSVVESERTSLGMIGILCLTLSPAGLGILGLEA